jgi:hypothetical protein
MRSALALLDEVDGTGHAAAYLDHAICLIEDGFGPEVPASKPELSRSA